MFCLIIGDELKAHTLQDKERPTGGIEIGEAESRREKGGREGGGGGGGGGGISDGGGGKEKGLHSQLENYETTNHTTDQISLSSDIVERGKVSDM